MKVRNPRNGEFDYVLKEDGVEAIAEHTKVLQSHQKAWRAAGLSHRIEVLQQWLKSIQAVEGELVEQLNIDTGRKKIAAIEVGGIMGLIQAWSYRAPQLMQVPEERTSASAKTVMVQQQWVPYGVVGVISPWNFPLLLALIDTIPALLAGSAVLLKPSEVTPRFIDPLEKSILAIPELANVLKLVRGGAEAGKAVVQHVDAICFTGSVPTGMQIAAACTKRFIPAFLELGGKDPGIVLGDADLEVATDAVLRSCVGATGQACQSLERIYVAQTIMDDFLKRLVKKANAVTLTTDGHTGQMGPLIFEQQAAKIQAQIDDAVAKGAKVLTGGKIENIGGGLWCRPTVLIDVNHKMEVMTEETFGPLAPIAEHIPAIDLGW